MNRYIAYYVDIDNNDVSRDFDGYLEEEVYADSLKDAEIAFEKEFGFKAEYISKV